MDPIENAPLSPYLQPEVMPDLPQAHHVAIVGVNEESAAIFSALSRNPKFRVVKLLNHQFEDLSELMRLPNLDIIIDTTYDERITGQLAAMHPDGVDIISGLSARLIFCSGQDGSLALSNKEYRERIMTSLKEIHKAVHVAKNKEELLKLVLNVTIQSSNADSGSIMLLDKDRHALTIETANGLSGDVVVSATQKLGKGVAGRVVKTKLPLLITGPANKSLMFHDHERNELASSMCCPLIVGDDIIGVLNINSKNQERLFSQEDLDYAMQLASVTAEIIETSRQYVSTVRTSFLLSMVNTIRDIMNLNFPIYERLNLACMKIANAFSADFCKYYEYDADSRFFLTRASSSLDLNLLKGRKTKLNLYTTNLVLQTPKTLCLKTTRRDDGVQQYHIAQPVKISDKLLGLIVLQVMTSKEDLSEEIGVIARVGEVLAKEYDRHGKLELSRIQTIKFSVIAETALTFGNTRDLRHLADLVVSNACLILEADAAILRLLDKTTGALRVFNSFSFKPPAHLRKIEEFDAKILQELLTIRSTLYYEDIKKSKYRDEPFCPASVISMCFFKDNRPLGALSVYDKRPGSVYDSHNFSSGDRDVFLNLCLQISKNLAKFI
jgi:putative methionine-R-sulfoxide reductase with GAF domain